MLERVHWQRLLARTTGWTPSLYVPLRVALNAAETQRHNHPQGNELLIGWIRKDQQEDLARFPELFRVDDHAVLIHEPYESVQQRSAAFLAMSKTLRSEGAFPMWQEELYKATQSFNATPLFYYHRGVAARFGLSEFATHLNGFTRDPTSGRVDKMWIATRSASKKNWPLHLDTIVGGGLPANITALENMVKESQEEAGLPLDWTRSRLVACGSIPYLLDTRTGLDNNTMFLYDLEMPAEMTPLNQDDEVESFELWTVADVVAALRDEPLRFKPDVCMVLLDFCIRHGVFTPDNFSDLQQLQSALHSTGSAYEV